MFFLLQSWRMNCRRSFTIEKCQRRETLEFNTRLSSKTWRWVRIISVMFVFLSALIPWDVLANIVPHWSHLLHLKIKKNSTSASAVSYEQQSLLIIQMNKNTLFSCTPMSDFCERAQQTTGLRQRQQLWSYLQTFTKKDSKYEKLFRSVLFVTQTDLSKCSNETGYRLQELILKMKQNTGKRFTLGYISSSCVRSFIGFRIKTGWQSSCFITSQSLVKFGDWASNVAFPWSPTSRNQTSQTSDANKPVDDAHWIFSLFSPLASVNPRDGCDSVKIPVDQQQSATTPRSKSL